MEYSPFCIPITAALRATGAEFETREIPNWDRAELLRLTNGTYYQVPVLVHDGRVITESSGDSEDIARYVDTQFAAGRLFPARLDGLQKIVIEFLSDDVEFHTSIALPTRSTVVFFSGTKKGNLAAVVWRNGGVRRPKFARKLTAYSNILKLRCAIHRSFSVMLPFTAITCSAESSATSPTPTKTASIPNKLHWQNSSKRSVSTASNSRPKPYQFLIHLARSASVFFVEPAVDHRSKVGL
jgi:hypothetical protein